MATRHALALLLALAAAPLCAAWGGQLGRTPSTSTASRSSAAVRAVAARTAPTMLFGRGEARAAAVESAEYDYIVVGGGTAGCVLANRLTDQPDTRVLVLEAGTRAHKSMIVKAPVGLMKIFKSKLDWNFQTAPSQDLKGREVYICRGKMLGGSSCANVVLYNRGAAADYDAWADECGDPTWNAENLLPYFKKAQNCVSKENSGVGEWHGAGGPQTVSDVPYQNKMSKAFLEAAQQAGGQLNADFNDWSRAQTGFGRYQVMEKRGRRSDAASSYLDPVRGRPNLDVVTGAQATGVVLDGSKRATGVRFVDADGVERVATLASNGEALLALGAIGSPHLLMTSGVGPADHLKERGVNVVHDLPGVGANLQDHPAVLVSATGEGMPAAKGQSQSSRIKLGTSEKINPLAVAQFMVGRGPLTSPGCDHGGFAYSDREAQSAAPPKSRSDLPDIQFRFLASKTISPDGMSTIADKFLQSKEKLPDGITIQTIAARPHSRGQVRLATANPLDKPIIEGGYLSDPRDVKSLVSGLRKAREILKQPALLPYQKEEEYPGAATTSDSALEDYVRSTVHTANAVVGTCKMGKPSDPMAVVDNELKVVGLEGVRVCDSSVMPILPGGQTAPSTLAIAEKAADIIQRSLAPSRVADPSSFQTA